MATRGMYIFEGAKPESVYVHWDNDPQGAAEKLAEWLCVENGTPETFCRLNDGQMEECEESHPDIEYRYRLMWPTLVMGQRKKEDIQELFGTTVVPNSMAMILVQHRKTLDNIDWTQPVDNIYGPWENEFCGPVFAFLELYVSADARQKYLDSETFSH